MNLDVQAKNVNSLGGLEAAITKIGATKTTIFVNDMQTLAGNAETHVNTTLKIVSPGMISDGGGAANLTINGPFKDPGPVKCFDFTGSGAVSFGVGSVEATVPEWWLTNTTPGTTNMTAALQAAITATPEKVFFNSTTYLTDTITMKANLTLCGNGRASIIKQNTTSGDSYGTLFVESDSDATYISNIVIRDLQIRGPADTPVFSEQEHLISVRGVKDFLVENCLIKGFRGDAIYLGGDNIAGGGVRHNQDVRISGNVFDGVNNENRQGVTVVDGDRIKISSNAFRNCTKSTMPGAIDVEPNLETAIIRNISIVNNTFDGVIGAVGVIDIDIRVYYDAAAHPLTTQPEQILISGNIIRNCASAPYAIFVRDNGTPYTRGLGLVISNNVVSRGILLSNADGILVSNNSIGSSLIMTAVETTNVTNNTFIGYGAYGAYNTGYIYVTGSSNGGIAITGNFFPDGTVYAVDQGNGTISGATCIYRDNYHPSPAAHGFLAWVTDNTGNITNDETADSFNLQTLPDSFPVGRSMAVLNGNTTDFPAGTGASKVGTLITYRPTLTAAYKANTYQELYHWNQDLLKGSYWIRRRASGSNTWEAFSEQDEALAGLTTELLVGGGVGAKPVWTAATGSDEPVRATSPTIATPSITGDVTGGGGYYTGLQNISDLSAKAPAYWFDGTSDYIRSVSNQVTFPFYLESLFRVNSFANPRTIMSMVDFGNSDKYFAVYPSASTGILQIERRNSASYPTSTGKALTVDTWYHVVAIFEDATTVHVYLNGELVYTNDSLDSLSIDGGYDAILIGVLRFVSPTYYFSGEIALARAGNHIPTAAEVKALSSGAPVPFKYLGASQAELMPNQVDRDFSGASAWTNVDLNAYDETDDLTITANAAAQYCTLAVASAPTTIGKRYRLTYDLANIVSTWTLKSFDGTQTIGTISANATQGSLEWTAETTGGYRLVAVADDSSGDFDNFTLTQIGCVLQLEQPGITPTTWIDSSGNGLDGTVTGALDVNLPPVLITEGNVSGATYGSDGSVTDAELLYINTLSSNAQDQLDARCLESVFGTAIGTGLTLDGTTLKASPFGSVDSITATSEGVAASVATHTTLVTTNGDSDLDNVTLADGATGQLKVIVCEVEGNAADTWKITPAHMVGGTQITFAGTGEGCTFVWSASGWIVSGNNGGTIS